MNKLDMLLSLIEEMPIEELNKRIKKAEEIIEKREYNDDFEICFNDYILETELNLNESIFYTYENDEFDFIDMAA